MTSLAGTKVGNEFEERLEMGFRPAYPGTLASATSRSFYFGRGGGGEGAGGRVITYEETKYGFRYGAATIERCCSCEKTGWTVLKLATPKHTHKKHGAIQIYITKTGKVRISDKRGEWTPPEEGA